ncbi:MAG: inositol monophosphatase [Frankiaceae bacterium]|nr:inositol monophosphatase [Frankiaceae bacterium]MBV9368948.1 inositol monophosphatase [Frankiales bacterium]
MPADPAELLALAERLATAAAAELRKRPDDLQTGAKSTPTDAVTVMDRRAERIILDGLASARPHDRIVAEESGDNDRDAEVTWYVDPLDGTVNYLYGIPQYAVSIAAAVDTEVVAGVVLDVARDETYVAVRGWGATRQREPLRCTAQPDPALALVGTGFDYSAVTRAEQARVVAQILPKVRDIRREGSAALDLCAVAAGRLDAYYESCRYPWDWAAGALIAREAGARVDGLRGEPPGGGVLLAANPALFDRLHELLAAAGAT